MTLLSRPIGIRPTGPGGTWTRRDHLRGAAWNALWTAACFAVIRIDIVRHGDSSIVGIAAMVAFVFATGALGLRLVAAIVGWRRYLQGRSFTLQ